MRKPFLMICLAAAVLTLGSGAMAARMDYVTVGPLGTGYDFDNIQAAINAARTGDTVLVADGVYTGPGNRDIDFLNKAITVRSVNGPAGCIIDAQGSAGDAHRGFYFHSGETSTSILEGFTIRNGYAAHGGGVFIYHSAPQILNCTITGNEASNLGGGLHLAYNATTGTTATILDSRITGNHAPQGGGLAVSSSSLDFRRNVVSDNSAGRGGGMLVGGGNVSVYESFFLGNESGEDGGGVWANAADGEIRGNVFVGNHAANSGGAIDLHQTRQDFIGNLVLANVVAGYGWAGGGVRIHYHQGQFSANRIAGNSAPVGGGAIQGGVAATIINSLFVGNHADRKAGGILLDSGAGPSLVAFSTIAGNSAPDGRGIHSSADPAPEVRDSILWGGDGQISSTIPLDVQYSDVDGGYPGLGNIELDPLFVGGPAGSWAADGVYDADEFQTILTGGSWAAGELAGKFINPDTAQWLQFYVVDNDATSITVWGDASAIAEAGDAFEIFDYHLTGISPGIDAGCDAGAYEDIEGNTRPFDYPGVDNNGPLPEFDMGAYELPEPVTLSLLALGGLALIWRRRRSHASA